MVLYECDVPWPGGVVRIRASCNITTGTSTANAYGMVMLMVLGCPWMNGNGMRNDFFKSWLGVHGKGDVYGMVFMSRYPG